MFLFIPKAMFKFFAVESTITTRFSKIRAINKIHQQLSASIQGGVFHITALS